MTLAFLVFADLWLLVRLFGLFRGEATGPGLWRLKTAGEWVALLALYQFSLTWVAAFAAVPALNFIGFRLERRARRRDLARLVLGLAGVALWSVLFAPGLGLAFRPALGTIGAKIASWTTFSPLLVELGGYPFWLVLFGFLLCANESNLAIRAVFDWLNLKPRAANVDGNIVDVGELNRGRVIGILERALLFGFVLQSQYGAIGFILAAKAFTRFKALDDRPFAEYVLIGTLLSACLAFLTGGMVRALLVS
jgi:hypothetical protein